MATKTRNRKSKPETNGTPAQPQVEAPPDQPDPDAPAGDRLNYAMYWDDRYWNTRVEAHQTLLPFRAKLAAFLCELEREGLIKVVDVKVLEPEEDTDIWEADKIRFTFTPLDGVKRHLPNVSIILNAEGSS